MPSETGTLSRLVKTLHHASLDTKALWGFKGDAFIMRVLLSFIRVMFDALAACRSGNGNGKALASCGGIFLSFFA